MTIPDAAASSSVTAPLVTVSVEVAHLEHLIVAIWGIEDVELEADGFKFMELSVEVELLEEVDERLDGEDGPAMVDGWTGI